jgi:hypothetical protein
MRERVDVQVTQVGESVGRLELDIPDGLPDEVEMLSREIERPRREKAALRREVEILRVRVRQLEETLWALD